MGRFTVSVSVPLVIGFTAGQLRYGVVALFGSMFVAMTANVDGDLRSRLLATFAAAILITGCAELGGLFADSPGLLELGVLILGIATGWIHNSHLAIEVMCTFAVIGFLFGASQLTAFGEKLIEVDGRAAVAFCVGGIWTILVIVIESWLYQNKKTTTEPGLHDGWQRIRAGQTVGLRFALCYGIVAAIALAGSSLLGISKPFWVTITTLVVMKPNSRATVQRTVQRVVGTLIGVLVVGAIIQLTQNPIVLIICIILVAPFIPLGLATNYTICCIAVTVLVMVMIDLLTLAHGGDLVLLPVRFYATTIGCTLAAIGTAIAYPELWWQTALRTFQQRKFTTVVQKIAFIFLKKRK